MSDLEKPLSDTLFGRVVSILERTRSNVIRAVNSNMVMAYWLIGREIVHALQGGEERAEYGTQAIEQLSQELTERYSKGFSTSNLWYFRQFYLSYETRVNFLHPAGGESAQGFSSLLSWSHYRALMRVQDVTARQFYEQEAIACGWSKAQLERQIHSSYYQRILANSGQQGLTDPARERLPGETQPPESLIKSPYVLEFLGLPDSNNLHENALEQAIMNNLQAFLLELGKGFSFVARQRHIRFDEDDFYIDLVFYNYLLKCFVLIDLKIGKLSHRDVGQMDGYVRLFEDRFKVAGDNPTIGLILCTDKSEAVAKYSILNESRQIFASEYLKYLPTEEQLQIEIEKERRLIEEAIAERLADKNE
jgi:predicted nuclease of restriction endonuclease-like (RecB) superfamily